MLKYIEEKFRNVKFINNKNLKPFYRGKKVKLAVGGSIGRAGGQPVY